MSIGAVLVPLLRASRVSAVTAGAALLLGCSLGGDLLNPGAPEWRTVADALQTDSRECVARVFWLLLLEVGVATVVFWGLRWRRASLAAGRRREAGGLREGGAIPRQLRQGGRTPGAARAALPDRPAAAVDRGACDRLTDPAKAGDAANFSSRLTGAAMLVGVVAAAVVAPAGGPGHGPRVLRGGRLRHDEHRVVDRGGHLFRQGRRGDRRQGGAGRVVGARPALLLPAAGLLPLGFAAVCGLGMATTQALFGFFVEPALAADIDPLLVGLVVAIVASAGGTMSPVAAIVLMSASMTESEPLALVRRVVVPLACGVVTVLVAAVLLAV